MEFREMKKGGVSVSPRQGRQLGLASLLLAMLLLPNGVALSFTRPVHPDLLYGVAFALFALLACSLPLIIVSRPRIFFLVMSPFVFLALPYAYGIYFFKSIPGEPFFIALAHASPREIYEVLSVIGWLAVLPLVYGMLYLMGTCRIRRELEFDRSQRKLFLAVVLCYVLLALMTREVLAYYVDSPPVVEESMVYESYPLGLVMNMAHAATTAHQSAAHRHKLGAHILPGTGEPEIVMLVIGESARADHFGINGYARNTTPQLASLGADLITYQDVSAYADATYESVPRLMTQPRTGGDTTTVRALAQAPSLVQAFKEAGYTTAWVSNQESDIFTPDADVETFINNDNFWAKRFRLDEAMLSKIDALLRQGGKRIFLVVHTFGSHIDYDDRYTARFKVYTPTFDDVKNQRRGVAAKDALVNSYDNSLLATDDFLFRLIARVRDTGRVASVLYTSDHGENLYDDDRGLFMHSLPTPTRYDTHVPLLVWISDEFKRLRPEKAEALQRNRARKTAHHNVFPTLLDMADIHYPEEVLTLSLASSRFEERSRLVHYGTNKVVVYEALH